MKGASEWNSPLAARTSNVRPRGHGLVSAKAETRPMATQRELELIR